MEISSLAKDKFINSSYQADGIEKVERVEGVDLKKENKEYNEAELDKSLKKLNKFLEDDKVHAEYSVHKELGDIMIKIVDDITKEVIMEVPPKKILDMIAGMCKQMGIFDKRA